MEWEMMDFVNLLSNSISDCRPQGIVHESCERITVFKTIRTPFKKYVGFSHKNMFHKSNFHKIFFGINLLITDKSKVYLLTCPALTP